MMNKYLRITLGLFLMFLLLIINSSFVSAVEDNDYMAEKNEIVYNDDDGLLTGKANAIAQLQDGSIWFGQYSGLTRYDGTNFETYKDVDGIVVDSVVSLLADRNVLYIGTQTGLIKYEKNHFEKIDLGIDNVCVNSLVLHHEDLYVATSEGTFVVGKEIKKIFDKETISVATNEKDVYYVGSDYICYSMNNGIYYHDSPIKCVYTDGDCVYLGGVFGELIIDGKFVGNIDSHKPINKLIKNDRFVYLLADDGLHLYDGSIRKINGLTLGSGLVDALFDYQGNFWLVSETNGVSKLITNSFVDYCFKYGIDNMYVTAVLPYQRLLYVSSDTGLVIIDEKNKKTINNELTEKLKGIRIRDLEEYDGKLYIATYDTDDYDVLVYDGHNISNIGKEQLANDESAYNKAGQIRAFCVNDDSLFIGTNYGLSVLRNGEIKTIETNTRALYLYYADGKLFACHENDGLAVYDDELVFEKMLEGSKGKTPLKCLKYNDGLLYSFNSYLNYYDGEKTIPINLGFKGTIVEIFDIDDNLFVACDIGLYIIEKDSLFSDDIRYKLMNKDDGLAKGLSANASGYYDREKRAYYFAGSDSLYYLNLEKLNKFDKPIKIGFSGADIDGKVFNESTISVDQDSKRFTFNISYFNYLPNKDYVVNYRLKGFENEYHEAKMGSSETITYTNLKGGSYVFELYVKSSQSEACSNIIKVELVKEKKFYEKTPIVVLMIVSGIGFICLVTWLIVKQRIKAEIKKKEEYKAITLESIEAIARTIDAKDAYTNGHSMRVGKYSRIIAERLGLSDEEVENIYYIALLHDIGKIAIPDAILNKPSKLTDEEFAIIRSHTIRGGEILSSISTIPHIVEGALYHHEKYDGSGYPKGLKGEEIPFIARIICCADSYDAMATKRTYKNSFDDDYILKQFAECAGSQFDKKIAEVVVELIKEGLIAPDNNVNNE